MQCNAYRFYFHCPPVSFVSDDASANKNKKNAFGYYVCCS